MSESDEPKKKRSKTLQTEKDDGNRDRVRTISSLLDFNMIYDRINNMIAENVDVLVKGSPSPKMFVGVVLFGGRARVSEFLGGGKGK